MLRAVSIPFSVVKTLFNVAYPFVVPSSGSIAADGVITLTTALDRTYANCYMYFPAGAFTASAAGFYYVVMSSTTVGQMYTTVYSSGVPATPAAPVAVSTGAGAYTQTTAADLTGLTVTLPAGTIGLNGQIRVEEALALINTAGTKTAKCNFGGSDYGTITSASSSGVVHSAGVMNMGALSAQAVWGYAQGTSSHTASSLAIDTSANVVLKVIYRLAVATDYLVSRAIHIQVSNT